MSDIYQWTGNSNADVGSSSNWADESEPGMGSVPGSNDVAIIQVGQGIYGSLDVDALDIVQADGAPPISIVGSSTAITAASIGIGLDFTLDEGAFLQAGALAIDGDNTSVTVERGAYLYVAGGSNDMLDIGASSGDSSVTITRGGVFTYATTGATGTLNIGDYDGGAANLTFSAGGYFDSTLAALNIGAVPGASGSLLVTGPGTQFLTDNNGYTTIGDFGELDGSAQGSLSVTNGGYASLNSAGEVDIGTTGGTAKVMVSGANSAIEAGPYVEIGIYDSNIAGGIVVQAGGEFDTSADQSLNNGTISVTGQGSLLTGRVLSGDLGTLVQVGLGSLIHVADLELGGKLTLTGGDVNVRAGFYTYAGSLTIGQGAILATSIDNAGRIEASGGSLSISGSIAGTGELLLNTGATLELDGSVVATQSVMFTGANAKLKLDSASTFKGKIFKFVSGDTLDLANIAYVSGASAVVSGTTLVVKDGSATYDFKLRGATASGYTVMKDADSGTEIVANSSGASQALIDSAASFGASALTGVGTTAILASMPMSAISLASSTGRLSHYA